MILLHFWDRSRQLRQLIINELRLKKASFIPWLIPAANASSYCTGVYALLTIADEKKRLVPGSMNRLKFKVTGSAGIAGICNGDPTSLESMQGDTLPAFNGLCQVVLRGKAGSPGPATLSVEAEGLPGVKLTINAR